MIFVTLIKLTCWQIPCTLADMISRWTFISPLYIFILCILSSRTYFSLILAFFVSRPSNKCILLIFPPGWLVPWMLQFWTLGDGRSGGNEPETKQLVCSPPVCSWAGSQTQQPEWVGRRGGCSVCLMTRCHSVCQQCVVLLLYLSICVCEWVRLWGLKHSDSCKHKFGFIARNPNSQVCCKHFILENSSQPGIISRTCLGLDSRTFRLNIQSSTKHVMYPNRFSITFDKTKVKQQTLLFLLFDHLVKSFSSSFILPPPFFALSFSSVSSPPPAPWHTYSSFHIFSTLVILPFSLSLVQI